MKNYTEKTVNTPVILKSITQTAKSSGVAEGVPQLVCAELMQNYPNPFNSQTIIKFQLAQAGSVEISICNILGQEIRKLADGVWEAGEHSVSWNGQDYHGRVAPSGVYLLRFQAGDFIRIRKLAFVR